MMCCRPEPNALKTATGADVVIGLPDDDVLGRFAEEGRSLLELPCDNAVAGAVDAFLTEMNIPVKV